MSTARLDQLADEIIDTDDPSDDLLNEFGALYDTPKKGTPKKGTLKKGRGEKFWSRLYQSLHISCMSAFPIRALEVVLISICLGLLIALLCSSIHTPTGRAIFSEDGNGSLFALAILLFVGVVSLLGQLAYDSDDGNVSGKLTLIGSLLLVCAMVCVLNHMCNYEWFSVIEMHRYVPMLFISGVIYILCFSSEWYWVGDLDCFFGMDCMPNIALGGFTWLLGLLVPFALWGLLEFAVWWISKI